MRCPVLPLLSLLLMTGCYCSHLADRYTYGDDGGSAQRDAGDQHDASAPDAGPMDSGQDAGTVDAGTDAGMPDDAGTDASAVTDAGPCGGYGQRCCDGLSCTEGACAGGVCATFGGAYQLGGGGSTCAQGNPLSSGMCRCPDGFEPTRIVNEPYMSTTDVPRPIYVCTAMTDVAGADYRGAYRTQSGPPGCGAPCVPNAMTGSCACPSGSTRSSLTVNACMHSVSVCHGATSASAPVLTFGGAYTEIDYGTGGDMNCGSTMYPEGCSPNPQTGRCSCPFGFMELRLEASARWVGATRTGLCSTIYGFCVKIP